MGKLKAITEHKDYAPQKVRADLFYGIDGKLDDSAKSLYQFLWTVAKRREDRTGYLPWESMDHAIGEVVRSEYGKELSLSVVKGAFTQLRKNRYLHHTYDFILKARVLQLNEFIGEKAKS